MKKKQNQVDEKEYHEVEREHMKHGNISAIDVVVRHSSMYAGDTSIKCVQYIAHTIDGSV